MWFVSRVPCSELQALQGFDSKILRKHDNISLMAQCPVE